MGWHLFVSICLAIAGTLVSAAFGVSSGMAALIGLLIFAAYWGVCIIVVDSDLF